MVQNHKLMLALGLVIEYVGEVSSVSSGANAAAALLRREVPDEDKETFAVDHAIETKVRLRSWRDTWKENPELFHGCSNIFFDVGSNRGTHVRKLFEPSKYPNSTYLKVFDSAFGDAGVRGRPSAQTGICAFGFEANPRWVSTLDEISKAYARKGWRAHFFAPAAVSDHNGKIPVYYNDDHGEHSDWGFGTGWTNKSHGANDKNSVMVDAKDLADFLQEVANSTTLDSTLMKMDIEGSEFEVLPEFLKRHMLCDNFLKKLTIEWHAGDNRGHHWKASQKDLDDLQAQVRDSRKCLPKSSTEISDVDDESYLEDGKPLP